MVAKILIKIFKKQRRPDISLAQKKYDWRPQIKLEEGLVKTINYFQNQLRY